MIALYCLQLKASDDSLWFNRIFPVTWWPSKDATNFFPWSFLLVSPISSSVSPIFESWCFSHSGNTVLQWSKWSTGNDSTSMTMNKKRKMQLHQPVATLFLQGRVCLESNKQTNKPNTVRNSFQRFRLNYLKLNVCLWLSLSANWLKSCYCGS